MALKTYDEWELSDSIKETQPFKDWLSDRYPNATWEALDKACQVAEEFGGEITATTLIELYDEYIEDLQQDLYDKQQKEGTT